MLPSEYFPERRQSGPPSAAGSLNYQRSRKRRPSLADRREITPAEWEAYLDEALPAEEMAELEQRLREDPRARDQLAEILSRRDAGVHSLGSLWRHNRVSCPNREELGSYVLGVADEDLAAYIHFHLTVVGCRYCQAEIDEFLESSGEKAEARQARCRRIFQSSASVLRSQRKQE
jgi:hypothetical protein